MAVFPTDAIDRLKQYNSDTYDPVTNPYGMADGGHRTNFPRANSDTASVGDYIQETASEVQTNATAAATSAGDADAARSLAQQWASNPEDVVVSGGLFSARHYSIKAAASAAAAATFDPANFISSANGAVGTNNIANNAVTTAKISANAITVDKQANIETARIMGRLSSGTGNQEVLTGAQVKTILGQWQTADIADSAVNFAKLQNITPGVIGRTAGGSGNAGILSFAALYAQIASNSPSPTESGYARVPLSVSGGVLNLIFQWGILRSAAAGDAQVAFPTVFPNGVLFGTGICDAIDGPSVALAVFVRSVLTSGMVVNRRVISGGAVAGANQDVRWFALGW